MDYEVYSKIKKGNISTLRTLQDAELPWAWFVCYRITGETSSAAELLRTAWKNTLLMLINLGSPPIESFRVCLSAELYKASETIPKGDEMFSSLPIPTLPQRFELFTEEIDRLEQKEKRIYLLNKLGGLGNDEFSKILGIPLHEAKEYLYSLENKTHPRKNGRAFAEYIVLSGEFKDTDRHLFKHIALSELFISTLEHDYNSIYTSVKYSGAKRKDSTKMAQQSRNPQVTKNGNGVNRRAAQKRKKAIIVSIVASVLLIAIIIAIVMIAKKNNMPEATRITTYNIDKITYGDVSTTISGSGTLSPITKDTLTFADFIEASGTEGSNGASTSTASSTSSSDSTNTSGSTVPAALPVLGSVSDIQVSVGETLEEGDTIASVVKDDVTAVTVAAPYDCVLLEFYLSDGDEVTIESEIAMIMGTDGYSMSISVDETNISTVELGQDVDITIDAVSTDEELVGAVTDISYNGSTSGSVTSYGIEVTFDYVEGTYPGMSVSAEIVIEDSGEGLLVPVDAVHTSGDTKYVYLAPDGASLGDEYEEGELDTSKLTKVTVTTGMSDGSYILIESSKLSEGDLIVITTVTSTLTGSESENNNSSGFGGGMGGGFGGGMGGGFPGGEMPEGFDPSNMPSFGGFGG